MPPAHDLGRAPVRLWLVDGTPHGVGTNDETSEPTADFPRGVNSGTKSDLLTGTLIQVGLAGLMLALLIPPIPPAIGETRDPMSESVYEVTGHVRLFHADPAGNLEDGREVVVWLVPAQAGQNPPLNNESPHYRVTQRDKMFEPRLLVVAAGSIVELPNHDPWLHNVFSVSSSRRFDLGLYGAGVRKAVKFDRAGVSNLFCSIHPEMMAIVLTVDSKYFGVSDKTGHISIGNVPRGKYFLHVWYENATPQALEALQRAIFVGDENRSLPTISIALPNAIPMTGKNENSDTATFVGTNWRGR
jgi:plastocyanin